MNIYYSTALGRDAFLKEAFGREHIPLPGVLPRTPNGKPYLPGIFFSLTHTEGLVALAIGKEQVGLDAERRTAKQYAALSRRLTERERAEDLFELWTAKEAYVKYRGGTLASLLPRLVYEGGTIFEGGMSAPVLLKHFEWEGCTLCLCTARETAVHPVRL